MRSALTSIQTAANDAINAYWRFDKFQNLQIAKEIIFVILEARDFNGGRESQAAALSPKGRDGPCVVKIFNRFLNSKNGSQLQTIAHEIYHCAQDTMLGTVPDSYGFSDDESTWPHAWWLEGSADYMSNVVYPGYNAENSVVFNYEDTKPIYNNDPYSANGFFQSMEMNGVSPSKINDWVGTQTYTPTFNAERSRLSSFQNFGELFQFFAEYFELGYLIDTNGMSIETNPLPPDFLTVPTLIEEVPAQLTLKVKPTAIYVAKVILDPGQTIEMSYETTLRGVTLEYRDASNSTWTRIVKSTPVTIPIGCEQASLALLVMMTSTDDVDEATAILTIAKTLDQPCDCSEPSTSAPARRRTRRQGSPQPSNCSKPSSPTNSTAPSNGTCVDRGTPLDRCLFGLWSLDLDNMKVILEQVLATQPVSVSPIALSGTGTFDIADPGSVAATYSGLEIAMTINAGGFAFDTKTTVNGEFKASLFMQDTGHFCLNVESGTGKHMWM
ncbi:hypothetical protein H2203_005130 [Taxawa tesnikishii (nom. ined.)]|nr:hypothetical protein H2203_005130 [Dothideales sp. JES 119]